jgi:hypothetical protein
MKRILFIAVGLTASVAPMPVAAGSDGQVTAQVTVAAPCITVGSNIDYGVAAFSDPNAAPAAIYGVTSYTNCSAAAQKVYARGTDAVSTAGSARWSLTNGSVCPTNNLYQHFLTVPEVSVMDGLALSNTDGLLDSAVPAAATREVDAGLQLPCAGSDGAGETMTFSIVFTASF